MVREYRAEMAVFDPEREAPYRKSVIVNDPLTYQGITFYQADAYPLEEYFVVIRNRAADLEQAFRVPPERDVVWEGTGVSFRIEELERDEEGAVRRAKISFLAEDATEPLVFWTENKGTVVTGRSGDFTFTFRQLYSTLLLAKKDPGVLIVYSGCVLMVVGLVVSFFLSHRRIWVWISPDGKHGSRVLFSGNTNKNGAAFERRFHDLAVSIQNDAIFSGSGKDPYNKYVSEPVA
jgi:cytochrome c biogenesis protein